MTHDHPQPATGAGDIWPQAVLDLLDAAGDRPVFEDGARVVGGAEMLSLIRRLAAGLSARGIGPGRGVILRLDVTPEAFAATMAAFAVGARVANIPPSLTPGQLADLLSRDDAVLISTADLPDLLATRPADGPLLAAGRPADIARITYTSGSTGKPKGCAQTYAAVSAGWNAHPNRWPSPLRALAPRLQRYLIFGSLSSLVMTEFGILALAAGGTLVVAHQPSLRDAFVQHRATASVITVGKLNRLVRDQRTDPVDLSSLGALMVAGSPLEPGRLREALDVLGPVIFHGYGQTEVGVISMVTPAEMASVPAVLASVGRPPPEVDVQLRDGELYVRTPSQASCYWDDPAETAEVFVDGWVRTRDLATVGPDGYLRLLGRARDVIIVNAQLIYAGPIELALASHPDVAEAYVVGRPDDETGEAIHAFVVPADDRTPDAAVLRKVVTEELGESAAPRTVTLIDQPPLTPTGKPDKRALPVPAQRP